MRDLVSKVRLRPGQDAKEILTQTYATVWHLAADEVMRRWGSGITPPQPAPWLEVTQVVDDTQKVLGFNVWLFWGEPRVLGGISLPVEIETTKED